jgi:hypothetical protein
MEMLPFYRRPAFRTGAILAFMLAVYGWASWSGGEAMTPSPGITIFLGLLSLLGIAIFIGQFIPPGQQVWTYPGEVLRWLVVAAWAGLHLLTLLPEPNRPALRTTLTHLDLALVSLLLTVGLTSQFVLPVRSLGERATVIGRLLRYLVGVSGPVMFVHNGRAQESGQDRKRRGPGVLLVDHDSAAVLRTDVRFTRAVGPGLTFTAPGERLAEALDLRPQVRRLPAQQPTTAEEAEKQAGSSLAVTKYGIPVSADLSVTFVLHPGGGGRTHRPRGDHDLPFEFYPIAAGRAVYGHAYGGRYDVPWTKLPLLLVVDIWREQARNWELPALLRPSREGRLPLGRIQHEILGRLTSPTYMGTDAEGKPSRKPSREFRILHERGIRVLDVDISGLTLPADVRDERALRWRESWSGAIHEMLTDAEQEAQSRRRIGEREACKDLCENLTAGLRSDLASGVAPNRRDTLSLILMDALRLSGGKELLPEGSSLAAHLVRIRTQVLGLDSDCKEPGPEGQA